MRNSRRKRRHRRYQTAEGERLLGKQVYYGSTSERTVRSATYCVINVLTRNSFNSVRKNHPEFGQLLDATIIRNLSIQRAEMTHMTKEGKNFSII